MAHDVKIIITTFMREHSQKAIFQIPRELYHVTYMFTREDRVEALRKQIPDGVNIIANPMDIDGIADIRQRCIDNPKIGKGKVWFIDDLTTFGWRDSDGKLHAEMGPDKFLECYETLSKYLDTYMQVGFSARAGNNYIKTPTSEIGRAYTTYGLRTDWMNTHDIRFDGMYRNDKNVKLYEDYYITLSMLTRGHPNLIIYEYYFNYKHNSSGGNSTFRNHQLQVRAAYALHAQFPRYVQIVKKNGPWGELGNMIDRTEVRIKWAQAYREANTSTARPLL